VISGTRAAAAPLGGDADADTDDAPATVWASLLAGIAVTGTGVLADVVRGEVKPGRFDRLPGGADREPFGMWFGGW
jgi:hypothetical protein